jgi:DNA mismatch repair ATPase MutS
MHFDVDNRSMQLNVRNPRCSTLTIRITKRLSCDSPRVSMAGAAVVLSDYQLSQTVSHGYSRLCWGRHSMGTGAGGH